MKESDISNKLLNAIEKQAKEMWGEKWIAALSNAYSDVVGEDSKARYIQIKRIFESRNCNIKTLGNLLEAMDCNLQLVCIKRKLVEI
jgi:hypothetical protein